jgi:ubiquinone/menaquinone biosynthesis C-methylase UbiE
MLLNKIEFAITNNPLRAAIQRWFEGRRLLQMGQKIESGLALELGCGRGVGVEIILDMFGASRVDAFDLDRRMLSLAQRRLAHRRACVHLWQASATAIPVQDAAYDAVFDFAVIHHIVAWRRAVAEVFRVLRPGGRFYAYEILAKVICHPFWRRILKHPQEDRFDVDPFCAALRRSGFRIVNVKDLRGEFAWFVADKPL